MKRIGIPLTFLLLTAVSSVYGQIESYRSIEAEYINARERFGTLRSVADYEDLQRLRTELTATVSPDRLKGEDFVDYLCLAHLVDSALSVFDDKDLRRTDPGVWVPTGDLVERAARNTVNRRKVFLKLTVLAESLRSAPKQWTSPLKVYAAAALKRIGSQRKSTAATFT